MNIQITAYPAFTPAMSRTTSPSVQFGQKQDPIKLAFDDAARRANKTIAKMDAAVAEAGYRAAMRATTWSLRPVLNYLLGGR